MAFNPFESMRKNSRVLMAGLAILCMFLFVFSSGVGRGDVLDIMADWAGGSGRVPVLATVEGRKYNGEQFIEIQTRRRIADRYMREAVAAAHLNILAQVSNEMNNFDPAVRQVVEQYVQWKFLLINDPVRFLPIYRMFFLEQRGNRFLEILPFLSNSEGPNKNTQMQLVGLLGRMLEHDRNFYTADRNLSDTYFGGRADNLEDTVNFIVWKHQADRLAIRFTDPEIKSFVTRELLNNLTDQADVQIVQILKREFRGFTPEILFAALKDEYAVRTAQTAMHGNFQTAIPAVVTPAEAWDWFRDVRTTIRVGLIELPVESFLDQVTAEPSEAELKALFDKFRAEEYSPQRDEPGFKDPRKIRVEWFEVPAAAEYYRNLAERMQPVRMAMIRQALAAPTAEPIGIGFVGPLALALAPGIDDAPLSAEFVRYRRDDGTPWTDAMLFGRRGGLHDSSVITPTGIASAATGGALAGPLAAAMSLDAAAVATELQARSRLGTSAVLAAAVDPWAVTSLWLLQTPEPLPLEAVRPVLAEKILDDARERLVAADLTRFQNEVKQRLQLTDKNNVQAYVNEFIHQRGFRRGGTNELRDRYDIATDPGLEPLKSAFSSGHGVADPLFRDYAQTFFNERSQLYEPTPFPGRQGSQFYFWRTEDRDARSVPFDKARPRVRAAWRMMQARELAAKAAARIAEEAKSLRGDQQKLRDLALRSGGREWIELKPQAKLNPTIDPIPNSGGRRPLPFTVPEEVVAYPGQMGSRLIELRQEPIGAVRVVEDQPKSHYFVAVLLGKAEPLLDEFRRTYAQSMARFDADPLLRELIRERILAYPGLVLNQLRDDMKVVVTPPRRDDGDEPRPGG